MAKRIIALLLCVLLTVPLNVSSFATEGNTAAYEADILQEEPQQEWWQPHFVTSGMIQMEQFELNSPDEEIRVQVRSYPYSLLPYLDMELLEYDKDILSVTLWRNNSFLLKAKGNGTTTLRYPVHYGANRIYWAEAEVKVNVKEKEFALYGENGQPLELQPAESSGDVLIRSYPLVLMETENGQAVAERSEDIVSAEMLRCVDRSDESNHAAGHCLSLTEDEWGRAVVQTCNLRPGSYRMDLRLTLSSGEQLDFSLDYTVQSGSSDSASFYVGKQEGDFESIQEALDAAARSTAEKRYVVLREGSYAAEAVNKEKPGQLCLAQLGEECSYFALSAQGEVSIKGSFRNEGSLPVRLSGLHFEGEGEGTGLFSKSVLSLENVSISGYAVGVDAPLSPAESSNVFAEHCGIALLLSGVQNDIPDSVYSGFTFSNNTIALQLSEAAGGFFKIRGSSFINNEINIVDNSACSVNAALNCFHYDDGNYDRLQASFEGDFDGKQDVISPYYRQKEEMDKGKDGRTYLAPWEMKGLTLDAAEADRMLSTKEFVGYELQLNLADSTAHREQGIYAAWDFGLIEAVDVDFFNPYLDFSLSEEAQKTVDEQDKLGSYQAVSFHHHGDLHSDALVSVRKEVDFRAEQLYLYKVEAGELILTDSEVKDNGLYYVFPRGSCSDYVITDTVVEDFPLPEQGESSVGGSNGQSDDYNVYIPLSELKEKLHSSKDKVSVSVSKRYLIPTAVFDELAKWPEKSLTLRGDGYSWTFCGADVCYDMSSRQMDTRISGSSPYSKELRRLIGTAETQFVSMKYSGRLAASCSLGVQVKDSLCQDALYVYRYNEESQKLELIAKDVHCNANGNLYVDVLYGGTYLISAEEFSAELLSLPSAEKENPSTGA